MNTGKQKRVIPGTTLFDGDMARKGYALNKMCFFNVCPCLVAQRSCRKSERHRTP